MRRRRALVAVVASLLVATTAAPAAGEARVSFELFTQHGSRFTERDMVGMPTALFFGFTSCPDVCPTTLMELSSDLQALAADGDRIKVVFVSIDPEHDTQVHLREYMASFDPRIVALSGSPDAIAALARAYGAKYRRVPTSSGYTFDHTAAVFLLDRHGETFAVVSTGEPQPQRLGKLKDLLR
jgi:protein SCO1